MAGMSIDLVPTVPSDYDAAHAAGWTYHRNGVSGCGFYAKVEAGALHVAWQVDDDYDLEAEPTYPVAASIPLRVLAGLADLPAVGAVYPRDLRRTATNIQHVVESADGLPTLHVFDLIEVTPNPDLSGRCLVVSDLIEGEDPRVAAFDLSEVLRGDVSTTLRGDVLHREAVFVAEAARS